MLTRRHTILSAIAASAGILGLAGKAPAAGPRIYGVDWALNPDISFTTTSDATRVVLSVTPDAANLANCVYPAAVVLSIAEQLNARDFWVHADYPKDNDGIDITCLAGVTMPGTVQRLDDGRISVMVRHVRTPFGDVAWERWRAGTLSVGTSLNADVGGDDADTLRVCLPATLMCLAFYQRPDPYSPRADA